MDITTFNLPVFPLPLFLLPQGITKLRIFEPRYLRMISTATRNNGFVIVLDNADQPFSQTHWGSWVEIINFDQGVDGVLTVDVKCTHLLDIKALWVDKNRLNHAQVSLRHHWPTSDDGEDIQKLSLPLQKLMAENDTLNRLYHGQFNHNGVWIVARWLELVPLNTVIKQTFTEQSSYQQALSFVKSIVLPAP